MMRPFTREDFDGRGCDNCDDHAHGEMLIVQQRCHPRAGIKVVYQESEPGVLELYCYLCEKIVVRVLVARADEGKSDAP
jgi:hypothetical protein